MIKSPLKWTGIKGRQLEMIMNLFPNHKTFYEPFLGSGIILGNNDKYKEKCIGSDIFKDDIEILNIVKHNPKLLMSSYTYHWENFQNENETYYYKWSEFDKIPYDEYSK